MVSRTPSPDYWHPSFRHEMSHQPVPRTPRPSPQAEPLVPPFLELPAAAAMPLLPTGGHDHVVSAQPAVSLQRSFAEPWSRPALKAAWSPAAIRAVAEQISATQILLQSPAAGQLHKSMLDNLLNMIPLEVQALYPRLQSLQAQMEAQNDGGMVSNACGSQFLAQLARLVAGAEAWHESSLGEDALSTNADETMGANSSNAASKSHHQTL